jgi:hypothetical protein
LYEFDSLSEEFRELGGWDALKAHISAQPELLYLPVDETEARDAEENHAPVFLLEYVFDATLAYWRQYEASLTHVAGVVTEGSPLSLRSARAFWVFWRDLLEILAEQAACLMPAAVAVCMLRWTPALLRALGQSKEPTDARNAVALRNTLQALGLVQTQAVQRVPEPVARQASAATAKVIVRMLWPSEEDAFPLITEWGLDRLQAVLDGVVAEPDSPSDARVASLRLLHEIQQRLDTALERISHRMAVTENTEAVQAIQGTLQRASRLVHDRQQRVAAGLPESHPSRNSSLGTANTLGSTNSRRSATSEERVAVSHCKDTDPTAHASAGSHPGISQNTTNATDSVATIEVAVWSHLESAVQILRAKPAADWEKRVDALIFIEEQARRLSRGDLVEFLRQSSLRYALAEQIHDLRSQVVRQACATSAALALALGDTFAEILGLVLVPALLRTAIITIAVIAESARDVLRCVVKHARLGRSVLFLFQNLADPKNATSLREITAELLYLALANQPPVDIERYANEWRQAIRTGLEDASACVRARMRHAFWRYVSFLCRQAVAGTDMPLTQKNHHDVETVAATLCHQLECDVLQSLRPSTRRTLMGHCPNEHGSPRHLETLAEQQGVLFQPLYAAVCQQLIHSDEQGHKGTQNKENSSPNESSRYRFRIKSPTVGNPDRNGHSVELRPLGSALGGALRVGLGPECTDGRFHSSGPARLAVGCTAPSEMSEESREAPLPPQGQGPQKVSRATDTLLPRSAKWRPARRAIVTHSSAADTAPAEIQTAVDATPGISSSTSPLPFGLASADWTQRLGRLLTELQRIGPDWRARLDALIALETVLREANTLPRASSQLPTTSLSSPSAAHAEAFVAHDETLDQDCTLQLVACLHRCLLEKQSSVMQQAERVCLACLALIPQYLSPSDLEQALYIYPLLGRLLNQWPRTQPVLVAIVPVLSLDGGMALWLRHCSMEPLRNAPENVHPKLAERTLLFLDACLRSNEQHLVAWQQALWTKPNRPTGALRILGTRLSVLQNRNQVKQPLVRRAATQLWETLRARSDRRQWASFTAAVAAATKITPQEQTTSNVPAPAPSPVANRHRLHYRAAATGTTAAATGPAPVLATPCSEQATLPVQSQSPGNTFAQHRPLFWESLDTLRQVRLFWRNKVVVLETAQVQEACHQAGALLAAAEQLSPDPAWMESALRTAIELVRPIGAAFRSPVPLASPLHRQSPASTASTVRTSASQVLSSLHRWADAIRQRAKIGSLLAVSANRLCRAAQTALREQQPQRSPDSVSCSTDKDDASETET